MVELGIRSEESAERSIYVTVDLCLLAFDASTCPFADITVDARLYETFCDKFL